MSGVIIRDENPVRGHCESVAKSSASNAPAERCPEGSGMRGPLACVGPGQGVLTLVKE
jgi:hypothetical protein